MKKGGAWIALVAFGMFILIVSARGKLGVAIACLFAPDSVTVTDET